MFGNKPNKLGWVTSMSFHGGIGDLTTFELSGVAENHNGVYTLFREWVDGGIQGASFNKEWRCLYCTSPNSINETHCLKCGAPRNFILG